MEEVVVTQVVSGDQRAVIEGGKVVVFFNKYAHEEFDSVAEAIAKLGIAMGLVANAGLKHKKKLAKENPNGSDENIDLSDIPF